MGFALVAYASSRTVYTSSIGDHLDCNAMPAGVASLHEAALSLLHRLQPYAEEGSHTAAQLTQPLWQHAKPYLDSSTGRIDRALGHLLPWQIAALTAVNVLLMVWMLSGLAAAIADIREIGAPLCSSSCSLRTQGMHANRQLDDMSNTLAGLVQSLLDFLKGLPGVRGIVKREHTKMLVGITCFWPDILPSCSSTPPRDKSS